MTALYRCPFCGSDKGYMLHNGETHRWWNLNCKNCGQLVTETRADPNLPYNAELPSSWAWADEEWNAAAKYAHDLRVERDALLLQIEQMKGKQ